MQTQFTSAALKDPDTAVAETILRKCVHCGFCIATCPTYVLLGDELDSPRGRIYLIKDMLENDRPASAQVVKHIDRCLSCLSCMTTCPSGVHYMHLVDHARAHIEATYARPWADRVLRRVLQIVLPSPTLFRFGLLAARLVRPWRDGFSGRLGAMLRLVALLTGCAQRVLAPQINEATIRLLTRHGCEVVVAKGAGCCGALVHHLGQGRSALAFARANIDAWSREIGGAGLDAIVVNASGCGTSVKDYGYLLREEPAYAEKAAAISALARDATEIMAELGLAPPVPVPRLTVAYQAACSLQHGQRIVAQPRALLTRAGFAVREIADGHLCCGSAGTYNLLQPVLADELRQRKLANIARLEADLIASGNIGCITQLAGGATIPVVHTVELLDWATGGPKPGALA